MAKVTLPFRQIHLDFHTSPEIPDVGADFDAERFADTMADARVDSVTLFAKCHHGLSYYPTKVGTVHPSLTFDLMGGMIEALHRRRIQAVSYLSIVRDELAAQQHQEWLAVLPSGMLSGKKGLDNERRWLEGIEHHTSEGVGQRRWRELCMNTGMIDYVTAQTEEILAGYDVDGFWFDIVTQPPEGCMCNRCIDSMLARRLDPASQDDRHRFSVEIVRQVMARLSRVVWNKSPKLRVFFNCPILIRHHRRDGKGAELRYYSHMEIESLPSGGWGYQHFPFRARYFAGHTIDCLGMTSRFQKAWGDCGSSRYAAALEYECFRMLAVANKCSIGDQLNPRGALEAHTYRKIAEVYRRVEALEPWCRGAKLDAEVGLLVTDAPCGEHATPEDANAGALTILRKLNHQFHVLDDESDFQRYKLLVLPDSVRPSQALAERLAEYMRRGGRILASFQSGLRDDADRFSLPFGLEYQGLLPYNPDFLRVTRNFSAFFDPEMSYVMYERGASVGTEKRHQTLAHIVNPYFNRTWLHFSGQGQTPARSKPTSQGAVIEGKGYIYLAHPVFSSYALHAHEVELELVRACLGRLLERPLVKADLPGTAEVTVTRQQQRTIVHVLNYVPEHLHKNGDIVTAAQYIAGSVSIAAPRKPKRVYRAPSGEELAWNWNGGYASCSLPPTLGYAVIVLE